MVGGKDEMAKKYILSKQLHIFLTNSTIPAPNIVDLLSLSAAVGATHF